MCSNVYVDASFKIFYLKTNWQKKLLLLLKHHVIQICKIIIPRGWLGPQ